MKFVKITSCTLVAALLFQTFSISAFGTEKTDSNSVQPSLPSPQTVNSEQKPYIIGEETGKREINSKTFRLSDGTFEVAQYDYPIHYKDNSGSWQNIDNSVTENTDASVTDDDADKSSSDSSSTSSGTSGIDASSQTNSASSADSLQSSGSSKNTTGSASNADSSSKIDSASASNSSSVINRVASALFSSQNKTSSDSENTSVNSDSISASADNQISSDIKSGYENKNNSFKVKFSNNTKGSALVRVKDGAYKLSWGLEDSKKSKSKNIALKNDVNVNSAPNSKTAANESQFTELKNIGTNCVYSDILPNVDLQYTLISQNLKENIILKNNKAQTDFNFKYKLNKLDMRYADDGSIEVYDPKSSEVKFCIPKPVMTDASGVFSENVKLSFKKSGSTFHVTLSADKSWINDPARKFPVTVDPQIETPLVREQIHETFVSSNNGNTNYTSDGSLRVGNDNGPYGICRTYIKFDLPALSKTARVTSAYLNLYQYECDPSNLSGYEIDAHREAGYFDTANLKWCTQQDYSGVADYCMIDGAGGWRSWNVTNLVSDWYTSGNNSGVVLTANDESQHYNALFYSSDCPNLSNDGFPSVVFHYTDTQGLEDYWSTHTQDAGRAGTGYLNDYIGNVTVVENDIDESGSRLPLSLNHVFNNSAAIDGSYSSQTVKYGKGWRLDAGERVFSSSIENYPYYLVDGDGTTHYFYKDPNNSSAGIVDEDGLGLTLTVLNSSGNTNSAIQIKDKDGNIEIFDSWSYLRVKKDSNGNAIKYNYSPIPGVDNYLSSITDGSGRTTGLQYNDNHVLTGITDPSGRQTAFGYDDPATGAHLTSITYPDGKKVLYTYDNDKISSMTNIDGYKITYTSYDGSNRCTGITETGSNGTAGNAMSIQYPCYNSTRFTDTVKNFSETYQFDNSGRTVSIVDDKQSASMYSYKSNTNQTVSKQNNKIASSAQTTQPVYNLIDNPGWENSSDIWQQGNLGNISNYGVTRQSSGGYKSPKCIMVTKGDAQSTAGAYEYFEYLSPGTYTFSTYVKTVDVADKGTDSGAGAVVAIYRSGILDRTVKSQLIKGTSDTSIDDGWQRVSVTFELKSGDTCINVFGAITNTTGTAYFDDFQLETGPVANLYNMLDNGSFDKFAVSGAAPSKWGTNYSSGDGCSNIHYINGGWALQLNGGYSRKYVCQSVNVSGKEGDDFILGGWAKADSVPLVNTTREFGLNAAIIYTDGTVQWRTISFNDSVSDWQYASGVISTRYDDSSSDPNHNKTISRIDIYVDYSYNKNTAYFDGIQFYQDNGESYSYDDKGNLVSDKDKAAESSSYDYDSNNNLIKATDPNGASFTYAYDGNHNVTRARNTGDVKYSFKYDSYGNPVKSSTEGREQVSSVKSGGVYYIRSSVSNQYLDVSGFADADGTAIMQHPFNGGFNQQFRLIDAGSGHYKIQPTNCTGRVIDINNGSAADGTKVEIWQSNGGSSQTFGITPNKDGTFSITTGCSNYASCLDTTNTLQDTAVVENKISSSGTQHFVFEQASDTPADVAAATSVDTSKEYFIKSWGTNDWLGIKNEGNSANSNVVHSTLTGREYQRWRIVDNGNGYYRILCDNSNLAVSVPSDQNSDNVALLLNNDTGSSGQQWSISYLGGCQFKITSACSSGTKGFDSQGSEYENLAQNTFTDATTQLWVLMPINETNDKIESTAAYTSDGNYMSSLTDARGNTVSYDYSHDAAGNTLSASEYNKGLLRSQTDAKGNKTNFSYDAATDSLNSVSATVDGKTVTNSYGYTNDDLTSITHNGFNYGFAYDEYGNTQKVNVGSQNLITNTYEGKNGNLLSATYGNGQTVGNTYDYYDRVTSRTYNGTALYNWTYDAKGNVGIYTDNVGGYNYRYTYDFANRPSRIDGSNGHSVIYSYDKNSSLNRLVQTLNGSTFKTSYTYNADKLLTQLSMGLGDNLYFNYDGLNRLKNKQFSYGGNTLSTGYTYLGGANGNTSTLVSGYSISKNVGGTDSSLHNYSYAYDKNGNITAISENGTQKAAYQYNELNELIREDNAYINKSVTYSYDVGGNLISKTEYAYTTGTLGAPTAVHSYGYGDSNWKDKLTSYDGSAITYDAIGNPLSYIGGWNFTWQQGRKLATAANGQTSISYNYNSDGIRTQKTVNGTATNYYLEGGNISWQTDGTNTIHYTYDSNGDLAYMNLNGNLYYYERNAQNDIIGLVDSNMNEVVTYTYDSWGKLLNIGGSLAGTVGKINPFRYRGYYYDTETGLYYLQSRYYDPGVGRFINADDEDTLTATPSNLTDKNLYSYCDNNPVMRADDDGHFWHILLGAAIGGVIGGGISLVSQLHDNGGNWRKLNWGIIGANAAAGALSGALAATGVGLAGQIVGGTVISMGEYAAEQRITGKRITKRGLLVSGVAGAVGASIGGKGLNGKKLRGIWKTSTWKISRSVSKRKIAMYVAKRKYVRKTVALSIGRYADGSCATTKINRKWQ